MIPLLLELAAWLVLGLWLGVDRALHGSTSPGEWLLILGLTTAGGLVSGLTRRLGGEFRRTPRSRRPFRDRDVLLLVQFVLLATPMLLFEARRENAEGRTEVFVLRSLVHLAFIAISLALFALERNWERDDDPEGSD